MREYEQRAVPSIEPASLGNSLPWILWRPSHLPIPHNPLQSILRSYYCKYSGRHALTTDCNLAAAPRRRTDHSLVIDTSKYTAKLYTVDGGVKFLRRDSGTVEKQYRVAVGKLPVGYRTEPEGRFLYIFDDALTTYSADEGAGTAGGKPPVPPCIVAAPGGGARVSLEIEDRAARAAVLKVSADNVRLQIKSAVQSSGAVEELLDFLRGVLGVRLSAMEVGRGETPRHKVLTIDGLSPDAVFEKFQGAVKKVKPRA
jgi:uncharacterized protein YggU (UPF0235/DUF167 family)